MAVCVGLIAFGAVVALLPHHAGSRYRRRCLFPEGAAGDRGCQTSGAEELAAQQVAERFVIACDTTDPAHPAGDLATETALAPGLVVSHDVVVPAAWSDRGSPHDGDARPARAAGGRTRRHGGGDRHRHHDRDLGFGSARNACRSPRGSHSTSLDPVMRGVELAGRWRRGRGMMRTAGKILALLVAACAFTLCALAGGASAIATNNPSPLATGSIPADLLVLFQQASAASPCGVPWTLLAAVAKTESSFDPTAVSGAGAEGMFQFEPATFAEYAKPTPPGGAVPPTPFDPTDAAYAAARYLCSLGVAQNPTLALVAYNCGNAGPACQAASAGYAEQVLATAASYTAAGAGVPSGVQAAVVAYAESQIGTPYVYGGATPQDRVRLLRTGGVGLWTGRGGRAPGGERPVARRAPRGPDALVPGDLVFFGSG